MSDKSKVETITIEFVGSKKFKQALVDRIYEILMDDDFIIESTAPGCGFDFSSSVEPTEAQE